MNKCDHKSVGMLVWRDDKLLLIERKKFPFGFAPPAGHVDEDKTFEAAAIRELEEEVGLETQDLKLLTEGRRENKCRREDGSWHYWKIYEIKADGEAKCSLDEAKQFKWVTKPELKDLARRAQYYLEGKITDEKWQENPGLELVWLDWLKELKYL